MATKFKANEGVWGLWSDGCFYYAEVLETFSNGNYKIIFTEYEEESIVPAKYLRKYVDDNNVPFWDGGEDGGEGEGDYEEDYDEDYNEDEQGNGEAQKAADKLAQATIVDKEKEKNNDKNYQSRQLVHQETVTTEKTYVDSLDILLNQYLIALASSKLVPKRSHETLRQSISALKAIRNLQERFYSVISEPGVDFLQTMLTYIPFMKIYTAYVQHYTALNLDLADSSKVRDFLRQKSIEIGNGNVTSLLILPIQRIPRYVMIIDRYKKHLNPDDAEEKKKMENVQSILLKLANDVDFCMQTSKNTALLFNLQNKVTGIPDTWKILSPAREHIQQGHTKMADASKTDTKEIRLILFNDWLLFLTNHYEYINRYDPMEIKITETDGPKFGIFNLLTQSLECLVTCPSKSASDNWVKVINKVKTDRKALMRDGREKKKREMRGVVRSEADVIETVNVFMRIRPFVTDDEQNDGRRCVSCEGNLVTLTMAGEEKEKLASYDEVFSEEVGQNDVFMRVGHEILGAIWSGFSSTVFAYGNTGAGKTYTMFGTDNEPGIIPRLLASIYMIADSDKYASVKIRISYLQVYNNNVQDLLSEDPTKNVKLKFRKKGGVHVIDNVVREQITSYEAAMALIDRGNQRRAIRSHKMNDTSSRSHSVVILKVTSKPEKSSKQSSIVRSSVHLVDLAGSENARYTGISGAAMTEAKCINQSLTSLKRVVSALADNQKKSKKKPIPFRDSALTRLLSESLNGEFVCSVVLNVSPSPIYDQAELTHTTMLFGDGVKKLPIKARSVVGDHKSKHFLTGVWNAVARK